MQLNAGGLSSLVIGRKKEITTLKSYVDFSQHVVITAPRRYGKTTLVGKVLDEIKQDYLIVRFDIFEVSSLEEFCDNYLDAIYASVGIANFLHKTKESVFSLIDKFKLSYEIESIKIGYEINKEQDIDVKLKKVINFADSFAKMFGKKMVVFMDEFGDVEKFGQDFIKKLRSYMQQHSNVIYIFVGSQTSIINDIFLNQKNAFFNFASLMYLDVLDKNQSDEFLQDLNINDKTIEDEAKEMICKYTKYHPFYFIKTIQEGFIFSLLDEKSIVDAECADKAVKKILDDNNAYFESMWRRINQKRYKGNILKMICKNGDLKTLQISSSYKSQLLKELKEQSYLNGKNKPTDPLFEIWIKNL